MSCLPWLAGRTSAAFRLVALCWFGPLAVVLAIRTVPAVLDLLGRDITLTGRTQIWSLAARAVAERPATGYGADAFWRSPIGDQVRWMFGRSAVHAHNAWLDIVLDFGVLGGVVAVAAVLVLVRRALGGGTGSGGHPTLLLALLGLQLTYSLSESAMLRPMFATTVVTLAFLLHHAPGEASCVGLH